MQVTQFITKSLVRQTVFITGGLIALIIPTSFALAWSTSQSADATCVQSKAAIHVSFTNTETDPSKKMKVTAKDSQTGHSIDLGTVAAKQTISGTITTDAPSLQEGTVTFSLRWDTNESDTVDEVTAQYHTISCQTAEPSKIPEPTKSAGDKDNDCIFDGGKDDVVCVSTTPEPTQTPAPTTSPTPTPTQTPSTITVVVQSVEATPTPTPPQVQQAVPVTSMPGTGPETDVLLGLFSLIPVGLKLRKWSK